MQPRKSVLTLLLLASSVAQAEDEGPSGHPPHLWRASATEVEGKVVVQIAKAWPKSSNPQQDPAADRIVWRELRPVTVGETVAAYDVDGKPLEPKDVLKALTMPKGVAVFVQIYRFDPAEPPAFYLQLLRKGTVVLVVDGSDVYDLVP